MDWEKVANKTIMKNDKARSERNTERVYLRSRIDLADAPSGGGGYGGGGDNGEGLIGGIVGAAAGAGGRFVADDGTRYMV